MRSKHNTILVTGGSGFIGSNFIYNYLSNHKGSIVNLDALTYAGTGGNLDSLSEETRYKFIHGSINDLSLLKKIFSKYKFDAVIHFAAESHVDRSIDGPKIFMETNILGTFYLLEAVRKYWNSLNKRYQDNFKFIHVSTDEVFGSLDFNAKSFFEESNYRPNSPYSASKASSDHIVRSYFKTFGLPAIITNCSNNYGPYQFPEKLIPLILFNALNNKPLPIYGDGLHIRDWLYVEDHCKALVDILLKASPGSTYNIGGNNEQTNIDVVKSICGHLDTLKPRRVGKYSELISYVADRPGHDKRYSIDASKIQKELGWSPKETFGSGISKTIKWYLNNQSWVKRIMRYS